MKIYRYFVLAAFAVICFAASQKLLAQISVQIGAAPVCPYGYFDYSPYDCAPYGYYGPEWFRGGVFIGAGPWYRGDRNFWGHVDNHYDRRYGYHGEYPQRGEHVVQQHHPDHDEHFRGNEMRDGHGHSKQYEAHEHNEHH